MMSLWFLCCNYNEKVWWLFICLYFSQIYIAQFGSNSLWGGICNFVYFWDDCIQFLVQDFYRILNSIRLLNDEKFNPPPLGICQIWIISQNSDSHITDNYKIPQNKIPTQRNTDRTHSPFFSFAHLEVLENGKINSKFWLQTD